MDNLIIRECRLEEVKAVHQLDLEWEAEAVTYGFGPSSADEIRASLGPYLLVAVKEGEIIGYSSGGCTSVGTCAFSMRENNTWKSTICMSGNPTEAPVSAK